MEAKHITLVEDKSQLIACLDDIYGSTDLDLEDYDKLEVAITRVGEDN
jgi:hypothetical protein